MALQRNFTITQGEYTFHYLARDHRLQAYKGGHDHIGVWSPLYEHMDEKRVVLERKADAQPLIEAFLTEGDGEEFPS